MLYKKEIYARFLFTLLIVLLILLLRQIVLPGIFTDELLQNITKIDIMDIVSGNAKYSVLALSITPIITLLLIQQLLNTYNITKILKKQKMSFYLYTTSDKNSFLLFVMISYLEGIIYLYNMGNLLKSPFLLGFFYNWINYLICLNILVLGACLTYGAAKLINIYGIGKGLSIVILVNIIGSFIDLLYRYYIELSYFFVFIIFLQCLVCSLFYFYLDRLYFKFPVIKVEDKIDENNNFNYFRDIEKYQFFSLNLFGILPIVCINSIVYLFKIEIVSFFEVFLDICLEVVLMMVFYILLNHLFKKYLKNLHHLSSGNLRINGIHRKSYFYLFLNKIFYRLVKRDFLLLCMILISSKIIFIVLLYFLNTEIIVFSLKEFNLSSFYQINTTFMFLYLIIFRISLLIWDRMKYIFLDNNFFYNKFK